MTELERLLESIHPRPTLDEVRRRGDEALNSFPVDCVRITRFDAFREFMVRFFSHIDAHMLRLRAPVFDPGSFMWGRCCAIFQHAYGQNGEKAAFELARTGNEGGLNRVLRDAVERLAVEYSQNEIAARVHGFWNALSVADKFAVSDEYLAKCGHLLPTELTEGSAARVRANLPQVLIEHPRLIQRLGQVGRS